MSKEKFAMSTEFAMSTNGAETTAFESNQKNGLTLTVLGCGEIPNNYTKGKIF